MNKAWDSLKKIAVLAWKYKAYVLIGLITILAAYFKFSGLTTHLHFDIDEATHTDTVLNMIKNVHPIFKGPPASSDSPLYHGAYYYYLLAPAVLIGWGNPICVASLIIILSIASVLLLYFGLEAFYGKRIALTSALIYAFSYTVILYSRWIWNPNFIPFFLTLAMFAIAKIYKQDKKTYLILLFFAIGSIAQVHVGSLFIPFILVPFLPWLIKNIKDRKTWLWSVGLFILPFLPTIAFELKNGFPLVGGFIDLLSKPSDSGQSMLAHFDKGYHYLSFMFQNITRLPEQFFPLAGLAFLGTIFVSLRPKSKAFYPSLFLLLTALYVFAVSSYYPDTLFIHFTEELFVLIPIALGMLLGFFFRYWMSSLVALYIIFIFWTGNFYWYRTDIAQGDKQFLFEKKMCQIVKNDSLSQANMVISAPKTITKTNPEYITFICKRFYSIDTGSGPTYEFVTDWRNTLEYKVSK